MKIIRTANDILSNDIECMWNEFDEPIYSEQKVLEAMEVFADQFKLKWVPITEGVPKKPRSPMLHNYYVIRDRKVWYNTMDFYTLEVCVKNRTISHYCPIVSPPDLPKDL